MKWIVPVLFALPLWAQQVTFSKHIAPIIHSNCSPCHHPGEAAPFSLLTYEDVSGHAAQIVAVTGRRYMPPWPPAPGYGEFAGERRLSDEQIRLIADWVRQGKPRGDSTGLPPPPHFGDGWQLGPPDLVVELPRPYRLAATGTDVFRNFIIPVQVKETKYVRAIELRPGEKRIVHHANLVIDRRQTLRRRDGEDGQPGFPGMDIPTEARSDSFEPDSHFFFWKPGSVLEPEPEDMSWRLEPDTDLILNMHLRPSGKEETVRPVVGLYFTSEPPHHFPMLIELEHDGALDIPAGAREFAVGDHLKLPVAVQVLAIYPHAHYLGKRIEAWATLPDGTRRPLIRIDDWDINWQAVYKYREPVALPKDTLIEMRISYDNSESNLRNPNRPPLRVHAGPRSEDEMGHVWLRVLPDKDSTADPRAVLQEALMRRRLEKYPGDFVAYCNLGALLEMRGKHQEAIESFEHALQSNPVSATARTGLGAAYLASGRIDAAIGQLRRALQTDPFHMNARWNLAQALVKKGDLSGAAGELESLLKQKPDHADAEIGLGLVYFLERRYDDALPHMEAAVRLRPRDASIRTNLGSLLASRGDFARAAEVFEQALRLNPDDSTARAYLARTREELAKRR